MTIDDLKPQVDAAFAVTGAGTPGWPDPHPDRRPGEEEYSRCLDPAKYRILGARVEAWQEVLVRRGLMTTLEADGAVWWRPTRVGALPLRVSRLPVDRVADAGVTIAAGDPARVLESVPDCGCDACDSGSANDLAVLDGLIAVVLAGGVVRVAHGGHVVRRTLDGWSASGLPDRDLPRRWLGGDVPDGADVVQGEPWF